MLNLLLFPVFLQDYTLVTIDPGTDTQTTARRT
jgi:hypothetical protein